MMTFRRKRGDDGMTMLELMVGMTLMMVFGAMFTAAIYLIHSTLNKSESITNSAAQLTTAFHTLDRTARYAAAVSQPGQGSSGDWYVELRTTNTGAETCTQLRINHVTMQLQVRTWRVVNSVATGVTSFLPVADGITNGNVAAGSTAPPVPFVLTAPNNNVNFQQLTVNLVATLGNPVATSSDSVVYPAVNSNASTSSSNVCQQVGRS
jgi:type II secretory pathway component PulJ